MFGNSLLWLELGIFLAGGAEQTGTTDLIRTAGAMKLGRSPPSSILSGMGAAEDEGIPVLILGGAGILFGKFCGLDPSEEVGLTVLIVTGSAANCGLRLIGVLTLGGFWGLKLGLQESKP